MTVLFNPIPQSVAVATAAGSGNVVRWTYTVPAGKRAVLEHVSGNILASAAAAGTTGVVIDAVIGGTGVQILRLFNQAVLAGELDSNFMTHVDLKGGDTVNGRTVNTAAVVSTMIVGAVIREYL